MEPMYLSIRPKETGQRIKQMLLEKGYTVRDIQNACGFENPQAIYKWLSGRSLPSLDNFVILSRVLHTSIEDILVIDGDVVFLHDRARCESPANGTLCSKIVFNQKFNDKRTKQSYTNRNRWNKRYKWRAAICRK